jgi:2-keto-4-pentenoate hydratase
MQRQLGVDQPDYGVITDRMVVANGGELSVDELVSPRIEAEFAFRIGHDLPPSPSLEELTDAVVGVAIALEIIDSRVADWKIGLLDTVADNASSARIVCGEFALALGSRLVTLPDLTITLKQDDAVVGVGPGSAVLGDPLVSLHWLATAIGAYGDRFSAGQVVLAGAVAAAVPLVAGSTWTASADGLSPVSFTST